MDLVCADSDLIPNLPTWVMGTVIVSVTVGPIVAILLLVALCVLGYVALHFHPGILHFVVVMVCYGEVTGECEPDTCSEAPADKCPLPQPSCATQAPD